MKKDVLKIINNKQINLIVTSAVIAISAFFLLLGLFQRPLDDPMRQELTKNVTTPLKSVNEVIRSNVDGATTTISLLLLLVPALALGQIAFYIKLPPLLGHLIVGIIIRNVSIFAQFLQIDYQWARALFQLSFVLIMIRCSINLEAGTLRKSLGIFVSLGLFSTTIEAIAIVLAALAFQIPIGLAILFGFVLASTSPAVTVPSMLQLQNSGLGTNKGIPTTILAAATIDNIYGVTAFNSQLYNILSPPVELFIGIVCGCAFGFFLWYFPNQKQTNLHFIRAFILSFIAMSVLIGTKTIQHTLVGPVVLVLMCVVAAYRWKSDNSKGVHREQACFKILWDIALQPFLFALIGLLFDFSQISWTSFGFACTYVLIGVVVRFISIFGMSLLMKDFNFKEKLFISICFFPKATVQAVLAPIILQEVDKDPTKFNSKHVQLVFQTCILSILLTAPLGQLIIWHLGKRALHKRHPTNQSKSKAYEVTNDSKSDTIHPTIAGHPSSTGSIQNGNKEQLSDSAIPMS